MKSRKCGWARARPRWDTGGSRLPPLAGETRAFLLWLTAPSRNIETLLPNIAQKPGRCLLAQLPQPLKLQAYRIHNRPQPPFHRQPLLSSQRTAPSPKQSLPRPSPRLSIVFMAICRRLRESLGGTPVPLRGTQLHKKIPDPPKRHIDMWGHPTCSVTTSTKV